LDRTRRLSEMILQRHREAFSTDYEKNKAALKDLALIPSKQLRNHIAGRIAKLLREEEVEGEDASVEAGTE
jgi:ribosomal protein S17E